MHVLRTNPDGGERANAMRRVKEPLAQGGTQEEQDELVAQILGPAAATDPSPVVRAAAIDALGRFHDPRVPGLLIAAYHQATGRKEGAAPPPVRPAGEPMLLSDRLGLHGPSGFPPEVVGTLRTKCLDGLARANTPEAAQFLGKIATGGSSVDDPSDRDVRLAAVRGLGKIRQKESVPILAKVLADEKNRDVGLASRAHEGLVSLTGKDLPPEPEQWNGVVQAGYEIAPEASTVQRAIGLFTP